jgi:hypothetical protein
MSTPTNPVTPKSLTRELGHTVDGHAIRVWLRQHDPRPVIEKYATWVLTDEQARRVRAEFAGR